MVVNRADAKAGATNAENTDPQLKFALEQGGNLRVSLEKEANRHREAMAKGERGRIGNLLGNSDNAPTTIAFIAIIMGSFIWVGSLAVAYCVPEDSDFWATQGNRALAFTLTALGYVFGRGSK